MEINLKQRCTLILSLVFALFFGANAQVSTNEYIDHKPQYRPWQDDYILDKIEYTKDRTILFFRFVCQNSEYTKAIFYPPGGEYPWYLRGKNVRKDYELKAIKNVRRNGELMAKSVSEQLEINALPGSGYTVFSCEVHFERLPNDLKVADLVEGRGQENNRNHFNCFDVQLKTWDSKDLGTEKDSKSKVQSFEDRFGVKTKPEPKPEPKPKKPDPKPEPKPEPEPEPQPEPQPEPKPEPQPEPKPEPTPQPQDINPYAIPRLHSKEDIVCGQKLVLDNIKFADNQAQIVGMIKARETVDILRAYMFDNPTAKIVLYGHTDIFGDAEKNMDLSRDRVKMLQRWLSMLGVPAGRIEMQWFGGSQPVIGEGNPINRRIEIEVICN